MINIIYIFYQQKYILLLKNRPILNLQWCKYVKQDVSKCKKLPFEGIMVNVPKNYKRYVKRMYGDDCSSRYVVSPHTDGHHFYDIIPNSKKRMLIWETLDKIDTTTCRTFSGLLTNQLLMQEKDKFKNSLTIISEHIKDNFFVIPLKN